MYHTGRGALGAMRIWIRRTNERLVVKRYQYVLKTTQQHIVTMLRTIGIFQQHRVVEY